MQRKSIVKRVSAWGLSLAMILGTLTPLSVKAEEEPFAFSPDSNYAIVSEVTRKAVDVKAINWTDRDTMATGEFREKETTQSVNATSVFRFGTTTYTPATLAADETAVRMYYYDSAAVYHPMRSEGNDFIFADPSDRDGINSDNADDIKMATYIIKKTGENTGIIKDATRGYYLTVNDAGEIRKSANAEDANSFRFIENPQIIDDTAYIENVATGKLVTFQNQLDEDYAPISVTGDKANITNAERFKVSFEKNPTGLEDVVSFQSLSKPGYQIASDKWDEGAVAQIGSINKTGGGWEAIAVEPIGNGRFVLRDAALGKLVTVDENDILTGGCEKELAEITDREKFIIHTSADLSETTDLTIDDSSRTETSLTLSWTKPLNLYTDIEVWQKASNEEVFTKAGSLSNATTYTAEGLKAGVKYTFKLRFISGNGKLEATDNPQVESNEATAKTRAGVKPATPTNITFDGNDKECTIGWDAAENATHYQIMRANSMYGTYEVVETVSKDKKNVKLNYANADKNANYYRVVALNNGQGGDDVSEAEKSEQSEYVSLEKQNFGDHTLIFTEKDDVAKVNETLKAIFDQQNDYGNDAQFNGDHYQIYFKPGDYTTTDCMYLGFYTSFNGLGKTPYDVELNNIAIPAYLPGGALGGQDNNATCNFWRSTENLSVKNTGNEQGKAGFGSNRVDQFNWAVAQAAPLRRVYSERPVAYDWNYGWASGGYVADCKFVGTFEDHGNMLSAGTFSGQQFYTRNSELTGNAFGTTLNNFYQGVTAPNLPQADSKTGEALVNGNGASNWNIAAADGGQQVFTNVETTPKLSEKPFLYIDDQGEYQVFVPDVKENTKGVSWSENDMGEGKSIPLSAFYVAQPTDTAKEINKQLKAGKNIYFTPGIYHAEEVIHVDRENTILLGTGMATIIPDNAEGAMQIADVDGVKVAGVIFDAGAHSKYLLKVGDDKSSQDHSNNPTVLQDVFFRVGGTTNVLTKSDDALIINSSDVIGDHFWIWRADHGAGVEWAGNESKHGLIVNGDNVTCYALFNEHFQQYDTLWNGENGATYFYQNEKCYDPISQEAWMSHNGKTNGYAAYKVANGVKKHYAVGLGIYNVFIYTGPTYDSTKVQIQMDNAIEVPNSEDVIVENACLQTFADKNKALQKFNHIINGVGEGVSSGKDTVTGELGEDWSRKFLISYKNGTAVVGNAIKTDNDKGKYIGVNTITNIEEPTDETEEKPEEKPDQKPDPKPEEGQNPYDEWKKTALISPTRGELKGAGPSMVTWNRLDDATKYEISLDGNVVGTVDQTDSKILSCEINTTNVAAHQLQLTAILENGDQVHASTRTFFVSKKGMSVDNRIVDYSISNMGESWYYNWSLTPYAQNTSKAEFVPMIWDGSDGSMAWLQQAKANGYTTVLGFNEPDLDSQANMSVEAASTLQPQFTDSGLRVGSAVTAGWASSSEWFDSYMAANGDQIDFIPMHLYMGYPDKDQVKGLMDEIQRTYEKYQKPIWITEVAFASSDPNWTGLEESNTEFRDKTKEAMSMLINGVDGEFTGLNALEYVERYAWFSFDTNHTYGGVSSLYETNDRGTLNKGDLTELGMLYRTLGNPEGYELPGLDGAIDETKLPQDVYVKDQFSGNGGSGNGGSGNEGSGNGVTPVKNKAGKVKTGDYTQAGVYVMLLLCAAGVCVYTGVRKKRENRK
ncbi:MAG: glycosyl hydrolase [Hespellia sp.]|nr:glycosyl hydrolase [Hespellia sp.]